MKIDKDKLAELMDPADTETGVAQINFSSTEEGKADITIKYSDGRVEKFDGEE